MCISSSRIKCAPAGYLPAFSHLACTGTFVRRCRFSRSFDRWLTLKPHRSVTQVPRLLLHVRIVCLLHVCKLLIQLDHCCLTLASLGQLHRIALHPLRLPTPALLLLISLNSLLLPPQTPLRAALTLPSRLRPIRSFLRLLHLTTFPPMLFLPMLQVCAGSEVVGVRCLPLFISALPCPANLSPCVSVVCLNISLSSICRQSLCWICVQQASTVVHLAPAQELCQPFSHESSSSAT